MLHMVTQRRFQTMTKTSETILAEALKLPPAERAELADHILASFEPADGKTIDALWAEEAESRIDAYEKGKIASFPASQVFSEIPKKG